MAKMGKTTGNLKMRSGPGMEFEPPIAFLVPDTELEILGEQGDWWKVRHGGKEGYVGKKYVAVTESLGADVAAAAEEQHKETGAGTLTKGDREAGSLSTGGISAASIPLSGGRETGERGHSGVDEK
jgi:hypothetical protein